MSNVVSCQHQLTKIKSHRPKALNNLIGARAAARRPAQDPWAEPENLSSALRSFQPGNVEKY